MKAKAKVGSRKQKSIKRPNALDMAVRAAHSGWKYPASQDRFDITDMVIVFMTGFILSVVGMLFVLMVAF